MKKKILFVKSIELIKLSNFSAGTMFQFCFVKKLFTSKFFAFLKKKMFESRIIAQSKELAELNNFSSFTIVQFGFVKKLFAFMCFFPKNSDVPFSSLIGPIQKQKKGTIRNVLAYNISEARPNPSSISREKLGNVFFSK